MKKPVDLQRRRPKQARAHATVSTILEAADQVLQRGGVQGFNTNAVAERAGVSIGTLYQYFPDKEAILVALAQEELAKPERDAASPQRRLLEALVRVLESLLGSGAARAGRTARAVRMLPARERNPGASRLAARLEEIVFGWLILPVPFPTAVRAASK
jgi:AcrR family transcriptional regulator